MFYMICIGGHVLHFRKTKKNVHDAKKNHSNMVFRHTMMNTVRTVICGNPTGIKEANE